MVGVLNQDLQDFEDFLVLGVGIGVLNQDLQDFEDFLVLGVVWRFESGFTGFRGFFIVRRWIGMMRAAA